MSGKTELYLENCKNKNISNSETEMENLKMRQRRAYFQQFISVLSGYILMVADGTCTTWTSPALPYLTSEKSDFRLSVAEGAWIVSVGSSTAVIGYILLPVLANKIGRKYSILFFGSLLLLSLILIKLATSFTVLLSARMFQGVGAAGIYGILPLYIGEIAHEKLRGSFLTFDKMGVNIGAFLVTFAGAFLSYNHMNLVMIIVPVLGILIFPLTLETPYYLLMQNREKEAIVTKMKLSNAEKIEDVMVEIERMKSGIEKGRESKKSSLRDLFVKSENRKALIIKLMTSATAAFSGYSTIQAYAQDVFSNTDSALAPEHCVMIMTGIQIFASLPSSRIVDNWGRRPTFLLSGVLASSFLTILGIFFFLKSYMLVDVSSVSWIPLVGLISFTFFCNMGLTNIPYLYMGELFSIKVKGEATMVSLIIESGFFFLSKMIFPFVTESFGIYVSFWIYAITCFSGAVTVFFIAPETKGKNLEEVLEMLRVKKKKGVESNK